MNGATTTVQVVTRAATGELTGRGRAAMGETTGDPIPANLGRTKAVEYIDGQQMVVEQWWARLPADTVITQRDALIDAEGDHYEVETVVPRRSPWGSVLHIRVDLSRKD